MTAEMKIINGNAVQCPEQKHKPGAHDDCAASRTSVPTPDRHVEVASKRVERLW